MKAKHLLIPFLVLKSFFVSVTQVAWGLGGMMLLNLLLFYLLKEGIPTQVNLTFLKLEMFIFSKILFFLFIFFVVTFYFELRDLLRGEKV